MLEKQEVGKITHFFGKINVAIAELSAGLKQGDKISIEGHEKVLEQTADSIQIDKQPVQEAKAGQAIGLKVIEAVKPGDTLFKVIE